MPKDGIFWYTEPATVGQKFSAFSKRIPLEMGRVVSESLDEAAQVMRGRVMELGRIRTGDMFNSIGVRMVATKGGRIQGNFGFIDSPKPFYTIFQEYGTRGRHGGMDNKAKEAGFVPRHTPGNGGIHPMHAFVEATVGLRAKLQMRLSRIDFWRDFR